MYKSLAKGKKKKKGKIFSVKERKEIGKREREIYNRRRTTGIMIGFGPDGKNWRPWWIGSGRRTPSRAPVFYFSRGNLALDDLSILLPTRIDGSTIDDRIDFIISRSLSSPSSPLPSEFSVFFFFFCNEF